MLKQFGERKILLVYIYIVTTAKEPSLSSKGFFCFMGSALGGRGVNLFIACQKDSKLLARAAASYLEMSPLTRTFEFIPLYGGASTIIII